MDGRVCCSNGLELLLKLKKEKKVLIIIINNKFVQNDKRLKMFSRVCAHNINVIL